jgi:asparagine synthase (glutamine-hydrolysing)
MCGIAGYIGTRTLGDDTIDRCLDSMQRRGPDAAGFVHRTTRDRRNVYLINTRLAILDLEERSNQPFGVGALELTYNGELYNYVEVRDRLRSLGRSFHTGSDTEVLVTAIDEFGWDALDAFEGMWAFAAFDARDGSVTLARDRFGEKPLYLLEDNGGLYFGSEPKQIAALHGRALEVDLDQVRRYLVHGYKALHRDERTFFAGLRELEPGSLVHIDQHGARSERRYWNLSTDPNSDMTYDDAVAGTRERLLRAVELRLRADVPLAFCMSGGVDSTALISVAKRLCGFDVHGFTIENDDARYDERDAVARTVAELELRHTSVPLRTDAFLDDLRALVRYHDAPVATITYFVHWRLLEQIAASGYKVSVSGTAADELFSGYYDHHLAYLAAVEREPALHAAAVSAWERNIKPIVRNPLLQDPDLFVRDPGFRAHITMGEEAFASYLTDPWSEPFTEADYEGDLLRRRMMNELRHEVVPVLLHEDDLNAMYFSVENRSPFLDRELAEFAYRIPTRHLVRDGRAKAVLRDAVRGVAPDAILDNPRKVGFNAPISSLLDRSDPAVRERVLADGPIYDMVRRDAIAELLDEPELPNSRSKFLFSFLSAAAFLEEFAA